ncbi:transmembrane protein PMIS2 [Lissotriton helveticus]
MYGYDMSKDPQEPSAPSFPPPTCGPGPMPGYGAPPPNLQPNPQNPGIYPQYNIGYVHGQNAVVVTQPTVVVAPLPVYEKDYLGYSIFNLLCCCLCLGIAALVFSIKTRDANQRGDINEARANSATARNLNHVSLGIGIAITIAWVAYVIFFIVTVQKYYQSAWDSYDSYYSG